VCLCERTYVHLFLFILTSDCRDQAPFLDIDQLQSNINDLLTGMTSNTTEPATSSAVRRKVALITGITGQVG
jgi:hypothetical protein